MKPGALLVLNNAFPKTVSRLSIQADAKYVNRVRSGPENFIKDFEKSHVKTSLFQKFLLGLGSGVISITSPNRGDMIAVMGEVTGPRALEYVRGKMLESEEGRRILQEKPRISSGSVDLEKLKHYPDGTLGKAYSNFLQRYSYSPDERNAVKFVDDVELAYVAQRYREVHDLLHTLLNMPTNMLGEVTVKWVEALQTKLPMCAAGALFGSVRLAPKFSRCYSTKSDTNVDSISFKETKYNDPNPKKHAGVMNVKNVCVPEEIVKGVSLVLEGQNIKYLIENGEQLERKLLFRQVPVEESIMFSKKEEILNELRNKKLAKNVVDEQHENKLNRLAEKKLRFLNYNWKKTIYDKNTSRQYLLIRSPAEFAVAKRVFNEIFLRDKDFAPKSLLDFGSGTGTVVWAANEFWGDTIKEYYCVDSSNDMNELSDLVLRHNSHSNPLVINNVYFRQFLPEPGRTYDAVVSSFTFFELPNYQERLRILTSLWNATDNYLVLIENGSNAGHDLMMEARSYILDTSEEHNVECHVFAPCPHELTCPRLTAPGKRTPCNFSVTYQYMPISSLRHRNKRQTFSFLILKKSVKAPQEDVRQCRIVRKVLKRHRHAVCHLCTSKGNLMTLFSSASKHGKWPYKCVRHSNWGDLLPQELNLVEESDDSGELISSEDSDSSSDEDDSDAEDAKK